MLIGINKKRFVWLIIVGTIIIILHFSKILSPIENLVFNWTSPIRKSIFNTSKNSNSYFYTIFHYKDILQKQKDLDDKLSKYIIDESYIKKIEDENNSLKEQFAYKQASKKNIVLSQIISGFYSGSENVLSIDRGKKSGIEIGMPVVYGGGVIIGTILSVSDDSSNVLLLSDKNSVLTAIIQGEDKVSGVVKGDLDYGIEMDYIPIDSNIKVGDIVMTSGLEEKVPKGLGVGQVKELIFNEGDFFKRAIIYPPIDYQTINFVGIITN